jgi:hypothetical protein
MKPHRILALSAAAFCVVLLALSFAWWLLSLASDVDAPRLALFRDAPLEGDIRPLASLAAGEKVVVTHLIAGRRVSCRTYLLEGGPERRFAVLERTVDTLNGYGFVPGAIAVTQSGAVTAADVEALEILLRCLRAAHGPRLWHHYETFEVEYFRSDDRFAVERFVPSVLINGREEEYRHLSPRGQLAVSLEEWQRMARLAELAQTLQPKQ